MSATDTPRTPPPWETQGLRGFWPTVVAVVREPRAFFDALPTTGPVWTVVLFAFLVAQPADLIAAAWEVGTGISLGYAGPAAWEGSLEERLRALLNYAVLTRGGWALEMAITVPSIWVVLTLARLPRPQIGTLYRVWGYSVAPLLFVPGFAAQTALALWSLFLFCLGVHKAGGPRPVAVFAVSIVASFGSLFLGAIGLVVVRNALGL